MTLSITRRDALASVAGTFLPTPRPPYQIATFNVEVTVPLGHPLMGGGVAPAKKIEDPLYAGGFVLLGSNKPIIVVTVDWCEIRNDAFALWRKSLATAAGTSPERVIVSCIHQHDAPIADLTAEKFLRDAGAKGSICDPAFHQKTVEKVAKAVTSALKSPRKITHVGTGQAHVDKLASNRRFLNAAGKVSFGRTSATRDAHARNQPEGIIDPMLNTVSFWDEETPIAALSVYATHPMSLYGKGLVSADFPGMARKRRQADTPDVVQLYGSGCSGNVTAGKYNDGNSANRAVLADRLYKAMAEAWKKTRRVPISKIDYHSHSYTLKPRGGKGFTLPDLKDRLKTDPRPFGQCLAALGLSWRHHVDTGGKLDLPVLDLGAAQLLLLPGESYVEYQLTAKKLRPDSMVVTLGYGECATGYVPTENAIKEGDTNLSDWCWVAPGAEMVLTNVLRKALQKH